MAKTMDLSTTAQLNLGEVEVPEGMALSVFPPAREHEEDPIWWDPAGRDPIDQNAILKLPQGPERAGKLETVVKQYPRYGPKMYEKFAKTGRGDLIRELLSLGVRVGFEGSEESSSDREEDAEVCDAEEDGEEWEDKEDDDEPTCEVEPAIISAALAGHTECVKVLVEEGKVDVNTEDDDGMTALTAAATNGHIELVEWLLAHGAKITFELEDQDRVDDVNGAIRSGSPDIVKRLLNDPQSTAKNLKLTAENIPYAASSGKPEMLRFVLEQAGFPRMLSEDNKPDTALPAITTEQKKALIESLPQAIASRQIECLRLLLRYLTPRRTDGSFEYLALSKGDSAEVFNSTEDAMEDATDNPELFALAWETLISPPPEQLERSKEARETRHAALNRRLISACAEGCPQTVRLICEKYGGDVNHVSHKFGTTPLGRAAGSGANPLPPRLKIAEYLLGRPGIDIHLANGECSNGSTALALAVEEGASQLEMVKVLLEHGGPVDSIEEKLRERINVTGLDDGVSIVVATWIEQPRSPVKLMTREGYDLISADKVSSDVTLELSEEEARSLIDKIQIRKADSALARDDPKKRPLEK